MGEEIKEFSKDISEIFMKDMFSTKKEITSKVTESVKKEFEFIRESDLEKIVEDEYFYNVNKTVKKQITKISTKLQQATDTIIRNYETQGEIEISSIFKVLTNEIVREQNSFDYEDINYDFVNYLRSFLYRESERHFAQNMSYNAGIESIKQNLFSYLNRYAEEKLEKMQEVLSKIMATYRDNVMNYIQEKEINNYNFATEDDISYIRPIAHLMGIKFQQTPGGLIIIDEKNDLNAVLYKNADGSLKTENNEIKLSYLNGVINIVNKDQVLTFDGNDFSLGSIDNPMQIRIEKNSQEYQLFYNNLIVTDPIKRGIVIDIIKRKYPDLYNELIKESLFAKIVDESESQEKASEEIIKDEKGICRINPLHREEYIEKLHILGLKVVENETGVTVINREGEEFSITSNDYTRFGKNKENYLSTSLYMVTDSKIDGPLIHYRDSNFEFYSSTDYRSMNLFVGKIYYFVKIKDDGTLEIGINENGQTYQDALLIANTFKKYIPNAFIKLSEVYQNITRENTKENSKIESNNYANKEKEVSNVKQFVEVNESSPITKNADNDNWEIINLMDELEEQPKASFEMELEEQNVDDEIFELTQDPKVQRYIELMKIQEEQKSNESQFLI